MRKKVIVIIVLFALGMLSFMSYKYFADEGEANVLQTAILPILRETVEIPEEMQLPDLSIENVHLELSQSPREDFPFYSYTGTIVLKNNGGDLSGASLVLGAGPNQQKVFVHNSEEGFYLPAGEKYIVKGYEVLMDENYDARDFNFKIRLQGQEESELENNDFELSVFESPANLTNFEILEVDTEKGLVLNFSSDTLLPKDVEFEIVSTEKERFLNDDFQYKEFLNGKSVFSYSLIENSEKFLSSKYWESKEVSEYESHYLKLGDDQDNFAFYLKASNPENGAYVVSDIIHVVDGKALKRAEFAKFFVQQARIKALDNNDDDLPYTDLEDAPEGSAAYIAALYDLGLISTEKELFRPNAVMSRGDALRVVLDYYDVDLAVDGAEKYFEDVSVSNALNLYLRSLYLSGRAKAFGNKFNPNLPATKNFIKYLVHAYR